MADVRCDGVWLGSIGTVADLTWSSRWVRAGFSGCYEAAWTLDIDPNATPPYLERGAVVEIVESGIVLWAGILTEPERGEPWRLHAFGYGAEAARYICLDATAATTTRPRTAVDQAITRGLPWIRYAFTLSDDPFTASGAPTELKYLDKLLDAWTESAGYRWAVWADKEIVCATDPATPKWILTPGAGEMGVADDEYITHLYGRYVSAVDGATPPTPTEWKTVLVGDAAAATRWGRVEAKIDWSKLGLMDATRAASLTQARFDRVGARMGWTNAVEGTAYTLAAAPGVPATLSQPRAGDLLRIHGVLNTQGDLAIGAAVDVVLGEVRYQDGAETVYLAPVGLVPRDFQGALNDPEGSDVEGFTA